jgi:hypothetical protein
MTTTVGVGYSDLSDSHRAGMAAARMAMQGTAIDRADLVLLFSTGKHDPARLSAGVREVVGPGARLMGGYAVGIITHDFLSYDGSEVGIAVFSSDTAKVDMFLETGLNDNEAATGEALGRQIASAGVPEDASILLFYDTVNLVSGTFKMNMATPIVQGMSRCIGSWPSVAGMGMIGDMQLQPTWQWFDDRVEQQSAMALMLSGGIRMDTVILHGCRPASGYRTITKTDGAVVLEIDGRPALEVIAEMLGPDVGLSWEDYAFFVTLGVNRGEKFGEYREEDYANRLCIGVDTERQGMVMFENDLEPGMEVQIMRRSLDFQYIGERVKRLLAMADGRKPLFAYYIDCAGRAAAYSGLDEEEAVEVQKALPAEIPLLGVYSGVELAKVGGHVQALDWTGVLCLFSE